MGFLNAIRKTFDKPSPVHAPQPEEQPRPAPARQPEPEPIRVPEIQPRELMAQYENGSAPLLLDCREPFEWAQVRIPGSLYIPMNQIPGRLAELEKDREWVVVCAHGNRSYAVAGFLIHNGFQASSLAGGVTDWWMHGGRTESDLQRGR